MKQNRKLLDLAKDQSCVACQKNDGTIVACHYMGPRRDSYGGGMGTKGHSAVVAHLCASCHSLMDTQSRSKEGKWLHSEIFLHYCALTWMRLIDTGAVVVK